MSPEKPSEENSSDSNEGRVWLIRPRKYFRGIPREIDLTMAPVLLTVSFLASGLILGIYIGQFFHHPISSNPSDWGVFGDFIGGLFNPVIALLATYLVFLTYRSQKKELRETQKALAEQAEEMKHQTYISAYVELRKINLEEIKDKELELSTIEEKLSKLKKGNTSREMQNALHNTSIAITARIKDLEEQNRKIDWHLHNLTDFKIRFGPDPYRSEEHVKQMQRKYPSASSDI